MYANTNLDIPVRVGEKEDLEKYVKRLVNGETQLLLTYDGSAYITDGAGSYFEINADSIKQIYSQIDNLENRLNNVDDQIDESKQNTAASIDTVTKLCEENAGSISNVNRKIAAIEEELTGIKEIIEKILSSGSEEPSEDGVELPEDGVELPEDNKDEPGDDSIITEDQP